MPRRDNLVTGRVTRKTEIFASTPAYTLRKKHALFPWIILLKVCSAVVKEAALLTKEQTRIYEENFE
jgi:hypothetical protein